MVESDSERQAETEQGSGGPAHETAFTAESAPQSSVNAPDPFSELENLYAENAGLKDKILRTLAEMENMRRRTEKENAEAKTYAVSAFAREMLTFADNLTRAIASVSPQDRESASVGLKSFIEGMELTERDFQSCLGRRGVKKLEPLGLKFDPNFHEALFEAPDPTAPPGTVIQVVEPGYQIGDRVLRPAKVGIARSAPKADSA
jgi:molecular chaperone GrpE